MIKGNYKVIIRSLFFKNRLYTFSLMFGFTLAFVSAFIILTFLVHEFQADSSHKNYKNIYRVIMNDPILYKDGLTTFHQMPQKLEIFPEVSSSTHLHTKKKLYLTRNNKSGTTSILIENSIYADSNFLKIFDFELITGNLNKLLTDPYNIVLTKALAIRLFSSTDVVGESVEINNQPFQVTGVLDNVPSNSHLQFSLLLSKPSLPESEFALDYPGITYLLLNKVASTLELERKLEASQKQVLPYDSEIDFERPFKLEPLKEAFFSEFKIPLAFSNILTVREIKTLNTLLLVSILILFLSIFNYANYSQSRTFLQLKASFVRRVFGASPISRWVQFVAESLTIIGISFFISISLIYILIPFLNDLMNASITGSFIFQGKVMSLLTIIILFIAIALGTFSFVLDSKLKTSTISSGKATLSKGRTIFLSSIFYIQVIGSVFIVSFTLVVSNQINFIKNHDPGYTTANCIEINLNGLPEEFNPQVLKNHINSIPQVISSTVCSGNPISGRWKSSLKIDDSKIELSSYYGDIDFTQTLEVKLLEGRSFSSEILTDTSSILINETGKRLFELNDYLEPDDNKIKLPGKVIGIFKDITYSNLKEQVGPTVIGYHPYSALDFDGGKLIVRAETINESFVKAIQKTWRDLTKDVPFEYLIIEEKFNSLHSEEFKEAKLFTAGSIVCVLLCVFGLVGLCALLSQTKAKEIAIRKILGATTIELSLNYIFQLCKVVFICSILSIIPIVIISQQWLNKFVYKQSDYYSAIFIAFIMLCTASLVAVLYQIIIATIKNPIESLKYE
ncbi:MAG: ABC transporter permease [Cyclobacteriaceae bacterium]|nr:ABC transporter permease [Cyclobacteriaceae bacterium]